MVRPQRPAAGQDVQRVSGLVDRDQGRCYADLRRGEAVRNEPSRDTAGIARRARCASGGVDGFDEAWTTIDDEPSHLPPHFYNLDEEIDRAGATPDELPGRTWPRAVFGSAVRFGARQVAAA